MEDINTKIASLIFAGDVELAIYLMKTHKVKKNAVKRKLAGIMKAYSVSQEALNLNKQSFISKLQTVRLFFGDGAKRVTIVSKCMKLRHNTYLKTLNK